MISPIHKQGVHYSIYLLPCCNHNPAGFHREVVSKSTRLKIVQMLAGRPRWPTCDMCSGYESHESPPLPIQRWLPEPAVWPDEGMELSDAESTTAVWSISPSQVQLGGMASTVRTIPTVDD